MKRGSPRTKRKKATPVSKPVAKRSLIRGKKSTKAAKAIKSSRPARAKTKPRLKAAAKRLPPPKKKLPVASAAAKNKRPKLATTAARKRSVPAQKQPAVIRTLRRIRPQKALPVPVSVPQFLLEGDEPGFDGMAGLAEKFSLGPTPPLDHFDEARSPLPESYGTGKLFLTARDPHWLYAHWDLTREEQFRHNARSMDRHLVLRVHNGEPAVRPIAEYHVHPESKYWFVHVDRAGATYTTELGYYQSGRRWKSLRFSASQRTPSDNISADATAKFATIPADLSFATMLALLKETAGETVVQSTPLAHAVDKIRPRAPEHFPKATTTGDWTPEQEQALAAVIAAARAGQISSGEFATEKIGPEFAFDLETSAAGLGLSLSSYASSFFGGGVLSSFGSSLDLAK